MNGLPPLSHGPHTWHLPLADGTALRLCAAFLTDDLGEQSAALETILLDDPALLLWALCQAWIVDQRDLNSTQAAASWLAARARHFSWAQRAQNSPPKRWHTLLLESLPAHASDVAPAKDVTCDVLFNARAWLQAAAGENDAATDAAIDAVLPPRLRNIPCKEIDSAKSVTNDNIAQAAANWLRPVPEAAGVLSRTMAKLQAHDELQAAFVAQLHREKLASLKEFTYGASHELNNPLFNISSRAQVLLRDEEDAERRKKLATIYSHALRASEMIKEMALAAHPPRPDFALCDVVEVADRIIAELSPLAKQQAAGVRRLDHLAAITIEADEVQIGVALRALVLNALEAMKRAARDGEVSLELQTCSFTDRGEQVLINVRDNGPGLDARARRHLFDPFFSGYEAGRGLGFGLSKCWQIVEAHGGQIEVHSEAGVGTSVTLRLPFRRAAVAFGEPRSA